MGKICCEFLILFLFSWKCFRSKVFWCLLIFWNVWYLVDNCRLNIFNFYKESCSPFSLFLQFLSSSQVCNSFFIFSTFCSQQREKKCKCNKSKRALKVFTIFIYEELFLLDIKENIHGWAQLAFPNLTFFKLKFECQKDLYLKYELPREGASVTALHVGGGLAWELLAI